MNRWLKMLAACGVAAMLAAGCLVKDTSETQMHHNKQSLCQPP